MRKTVTKCSNTSCPISMKCYRHTCYPNGIKQVHGRFEYDNGCDYFISNIEDLNDPVEPTDKKDIEPKGLSQESSHTD